MLLVCYSYVVVCYWYVLVYYSHVLERYSYVLVWCLSHDPSDALFRKQRQIFRYSLAFVFIF